MRHKDKESEEENEALRQRLDEMRVRVGDAEKRGADLQFEKDRRERADVTAAGANVSRMSMTQDDMFAMSHIISQSNEDIVKTMLDHSLRQSKSLYKNMQAPKSKLMTFAGDRTKYFPFMNRFKEQVDKTDRSDASKLSALMEHCTEGVLQYIECCNYKEASEGYALAMKLLKERFGDPYLVAQAWMDKLMDYPKLKATDSIVKFASDLASAKETLNSIGYLSELECTRSLKLITFKLPTYVQNRWRVKKVELEELGRRASLEDMVKLVQSVAREMSDPIYGPDSLAKAAADFEPRTAAAKSGPKKTGALVSEEVSRDEGKRPKANQRDFKSDRGREKGKSSDGPDIKCFICKKTHYTSRCFAYKDLGAYERLAFVDKHRLCRLCLYPGHVSDDCKLTFGCQIPGCEKKHNSSLHRALCKEKVVMPDPVKHVAIRKPPPEEEEVSADIHAADIKMTVHMPESIYMGDGYNHRYSLPIVSVVISGPMGLYGTHALLDTGSAITMISDTVTRTVGLMPLGKADLHLQGINSKRQLLADVVEFDCKGLSEKKHQPLKNVVVNPGFLLNEEHVEERRRYNKWPHLKHVEMLSHYHSRVEMLIGQDNAYLFEQLDKIKGEDRYAPYGVHTPLGWTVFGHVASSDGGCNVVGVNRCESSADIILERRLEQMWEIDRVPESTGMSPIDRKILKTWDEKIKFVDGKLQVPIPFIEEPPNLPDNYYPAKKRLDSLGRKMMKDDDLKDQIVASMRKNFEQGYAEMAPDEPREGYEWYNPQQAVISDRKPGKCRMVSNASFVYKGRGLNLSVHQGPNLTAKLINVMVSFRLYEVVITGDIESMYNRVQVPEEQRDCLRFLWWEDDDPTKEVIKCRMTTQAFGGKWCGSASIYALRKSVEFYGEEYDDMVVNTVLKHFYVDDLLRSVMTVSVGLRLIMQLKELLGRVGFNLTKFGSNKMEILEAIEPRDRAKAYQQIEFAIAPDVVDKTLGSFWGPRDDVFGFVIAMMDKPVTRRGILSTFSSVYDPLGFSGPVVLRAKLLIQRLCRGGFGWDDELPSEFCDDWLKWITDLDNLSELKIPRWLGVTSDPDTAYQLHVFSDASEVGYGVVIYFCTVDMSGNVVKALILMSKCKVTPVKQLSIPRLELCAAVLAAKLEDAVVRSIEFRLMPTIFWSDSMIVLHNIKQQAKVFKTFIANRVGMIQELTHVDQWRHVPGELNIADVASRGCEAVELLGNQEWIYGPKFLRVRESWPQQPSELSEEFINKNAEYRRHTLVTVCSMSTSKSTYDLFVRFFEGYSDWVKLVRGVSIWIRLRDYTLRGRQHPQRVTASEYAEAEYILMRANQHLFLSEQRRNTKSFVKLFPFQDGKVWRVGGRLMMSRLLFEEKHPMILPRSPCTEMYIRHVHARLGHVGTDKTYAKVREKYWIVSGKQVVSDVIKKCVLCKKFRGRPPSQVMAPLPAVRIVAGTAPFEHVGLDYFGPILVKIGRSLVKRYCLTITCMQTRAAHLEPAADLSTSSFLNAFQRFISRRGKPRSVLSDNGTNFVGAVNEMRALVRGWNEHRIDKFMAEKNIDWKFNTPLASHHGGVWERENRTAREIMMGLAKGTVLTDDGLCTLLCLVEQVMNSRPLTQVGEDSQDQLPLSPQHLLNLRKAEGIVGRYDVADTYKRKWRQLQFLADQFWIRWTGEYIKTLQKRQKWNRERDDIEVGEIVILVEPHTERLKWPMGRILRVFRGNDGHVRSVEVRTETGTYERPITKLVRLEIR